MNKKLHSINTTLQSFSRLEWTGIAIAILGHGVAAFTSYGFHHLDEHFQIWEWANYYLGLNEDVKALPWEYAAQIRPWFQPFLHVLGMKAALVLGIFEPFGCALFYRAAYAAVNLWAMFSLWRIFQAKEKLSPIWFLLIASLWFLPYLQVRTSSENLAAIFLNFAFVCFLKEDNALSISKKYFGTGLLFGFAFLARYQIAIGLVGFGAYLLWRDRAILKTHFLLLGGFLLPVALGLVLDRLGYGNWVFAPYRYFTVNLVQGVAATFNPYPWYQYFIWILQLNPFISLPLFFGFVLYLREKKIGALGAFVLSFFVIHCFITNKEYRFLFPVMNLVPFMAAVGLSHAYPSLNESLAKKKFLIPYFLITLLAFSVSTLRGASLKTLWVVHTVKKNFDPSHMILTNRDYVEHPQTTYYTLPAHPHVLIQNIENFQTLLAQYPDARVIIDGKLEDQYTVDLLRVVQEHHCALMSSSFPYFLYEYRQNWSLFKRIPYQAMFECPKAL